MTDPAFSGDRLNLGCGRDIRAGWVNVDLHPHDERVTALDLDSVAPMPFADGSFQHIEAQDILEHVQDMVRVMSECRRILCEGGTLQVRGPHYTSRNLHTDPTHLRAFSSETFAWFVGGPWTNDWARGWSGVRVRIRFEGWTPWRPLGWVINLHPALQKIYEATFLCYLFPAKDVCATLTR